MDKKAQELRVKFDGELHEIDVNTYLNSLSCMSTIIQELNHELDPNKRIEIKIKAHDKGSFEVLLKIAEDMSQLLSLGNVDYLAKLFAVLIGVFTLKKFLKGEAPKEKTEQDASYKIENTKGDINFFDQRVYNIYTNNKPVNEALSKTFRTLSGDPSITGFELSEEANEPAVVVARAEFDAMSANNDAIAIEELPESRTVTTEATLHIVKLGFEDRYKWTFYYDGNKISASIEDKSFFQKIEDGVSFSKGDMLRVNLALEQSYDKQVKAYSNESYRVIEVLSHVPSDKKKEPELFPE